MKASSVKGTAYGPYGDPFVEVALDVCCIACFVATDERSCMLVVMGSHGGRTTTSMNGTEVSALFIAFLQ